MGDEANTKDVLLVFTNKGNYCYIPVYDIHEGKWKDEGKHINYLCSISPDEKLIKAFVIKEFREDLYFVLVTKKGKIKRSQISEFVALRYSRPLICIRLSKGDALSDVVATSGNSDLLVVTRNGHATFYNENELTVLSLSAAGVKAISRLKNDEIIGLVSLHPQERVHLGIITDNGHVRLVDTASFENTARLGKIQHVMRVFKSDIHKIVGLLPLEKRLVDSLIIYCLTNSNDIVALPVSELKLMQVDKYAKQNIKELQTGETFTGVYSFLVRSISEKQRLTNRHKLKKSRN